MAATVTALQARVQGSSLVNSFSGAAGSGLDILQISDLGDLTGGIPTVRINVDSTGAVHNPASSPTNGTRLGVFQSSAAHGSTTSQFFSGAWPNNPQSLDIVQVANLGGNISYWLDSTGTAHGS
jgi:hypothetical protein